MGLTSETERNGLAARDGGQESSCFIKRFLLNCHGVLNSIVFKTDAKRRSKLPADKDTGGHENVKELSLEGIKSFEPIAERGKAVAALASSFDFHAVSRSSHRLEVAPDRFRGQLILIELEPAMLKEVRVKPLPDCLDRKKSRSAEPLLGKNSVSSFCTK